MPLAPEVKRSLAVGRNRALVAQWVTGIAAAIAALEAACLGWQTVLLTRLKDGARVEQAVLLASDARINLLSPWYTVVQIVAPIMFFVWLHRAVMNARDMGAGRIALPSPGSFLGSFFIPFVCFFQPVVNVSRLQRALDPEQLPPLVTWKDNPLADYRTPARTPVFESWRRVEAPIGVWWALYIAQVIGSRFIDRRPQLNGTLGGLISQSNWNTATCTVFALTSVFTLLLVRAIDRRATEFARRADALPPEGALDLDAAATSWDTPV